MRSTVEVLSGVPLFRDILAWNFRLRMSTSSESVNAFFVKRFCLPRSWVCCSGYPFSTPPYKLFFGELYGAPLREEPQG